MIYIFYSDSGFDIRWATQTKQANGLYNYEAKKGRVDPMAKIMNNSRLRSKEAYYVKGLGLVATDGSLIRKKLSPKKESSAAEQAELQYVYNFNASKKNHLYLNSL